MDRVEDKRERFEAGVLYGNPPGLPPRRFGQLSDEAVARIKQLLTESLEEALPPAAEAAVEKIEERYSTTGYLVVGSLIVTAVATATLAVLAVYDRVK
jgi:hypothetical protein